jgi:hypothetical protein
MGKAPKKPRSKARAAGVTSTRAREAADSVGSAYDSFKEYRGVRYTGMKVGRSHRWYYDKGEWKETKETPDRWRFTYAVHKRRAGKAPEGSGVPVGTAYHWFILADQTVEKLDANVYTTAMSGVKFKVAHKRESTGSWSESKRAQRKRVIRFLKQFLEELEGDEKATADAAS